MRTKILLSLRLRIVHGWAWHYKSEVVPRTEELFNRGFVQIWVRTHVTTRRPTKKKKE